MYGLLIFLGVIAAITAYFCLGIVVKFLWGWFPIVFSTMAAIAILIFGNGFWQVIGVMLFCMSLHWNSLWHNTTIYTNIEKKLDDWFYFKD